MARHILITCAGSADLAPIIRDFTSRSGYALLATDVDPSRRLAMVTTAYAALPPGSAPEFVDAVFTLATRAGVDLIIPKADEEVFALMRARARFDAAGVQLAVQDDALGPVLASKSACYAHLAARGFPVPDHHVIRTPEALTAALRALGYPERPVLMKPDAMRGGRGVCVIAESPDACIEAIQVSPPTFAAKLLDGRTPYLVMPYYRGTIYDIDVLTYADGSTFFGARGRFTNVTKHFSGNVFSQNAALLAFARACYAALPTRYLVDYDILVTEDGDLVLLEVNARPSGSTVSYLPFGTNLLAVLAASYLDGVHAPVTMPPDGARATVCYDMVANAVRVAAAV